MIRLLLRFGLSCVVVVTLAFGIMSVARAVPIAPALALIVVMFVVAAATLDTIRGMQR